MNLPDRELIRRIAVLRGCLASLVALGAACTPSEFIADYGLRPVGPASLNGAPAPGTVTPFVFDGAERVEAVRYEDDRVAVGWTLYSRNARLEIENRTGSPLRVIWAESRLEGDFQASLILAESGTQEERSLPQEPSEVPPTARAAYSTIAGPAGRWQAFTDDTGRGFWQSTRPMFDLDVDGAGEGDRNALAQRAVGRQLRLVLPLEVEGRRYELGLPVQVSAASVRASYY
jgi:hypothetical protein